jgi:Glycosyl hydrolase family 46
MPCESCGIRPNPLSVALNFNLPQKIDLGEAKEFSFALTGLFEGGKTDSLQTKDSGIVSYGKFQATLASGSLEKVLREYLVNSNTSTAHELRSFLPSVKARDISLRSNNAFLSLLKDAAKEHTMENAQNVVFSKDYWEPAAKIASQLGLQSKIAYAIFFDTKIQGGLEKILRNTTNKIGSRSITEKDFLNELLNERTIYLKNIAIAKRANGDKQTAKLLESSIMHRISKLKRMV